MGRLQLVASLFLPRSGGGLMLARERIIARHVQLRGRAQAPATGFTVIGVLLCLVGALQVVRAFAWQLLRAPPGSGDTQQPTVPLTESSRSGSDRLTQIYLGDLALKERALARTAAPKTTPDASGPDQLLALLGSL